MLGLVPVRARRRGLQVVSGVPIAWSAWGAEADPPVVLVHGGAAHSAWWSWLAPALADRFHVVALDLSGHGSSGLRARYSYDDWSDEVLAVTARLASPAPPVLVGHSLGGVVTAHAASRTDSSCLGGVVTVDSPLIEPLQEDLGNPNLRFASPSRYPTAEEALRRFRPLPDQSHNVPDLVRWVAKRSIRPTDDGQEWTWHFDPQVFASTPDARPGDVGALLETLVCPVGFVVGGESLVVSLNDRSRMRAAVQDRLAPGSRYIEIPDGGHHLMLDRPMELLKVVQACLDEWVLR